MRILLFFLWISLALCQNQSVVPFFGTGSPAQTCHIGELYFDITGIFPANVWYCTVPNLWRQTQTFLIQPGMIVMITSGTCAPGFAEAAELNGFMVRGTVAANGNVGTTGGSDTVTPAGTVSQPTFTGNLLAGHLHIFTGAALGTHTHTAVSTVPLPHLVNSTTGPPGVAEVMNPVSAGVPAGSLSTVSAGTPSGIVSRPTFTGAPLDNRPAFVNVIFCKKL
jgi:hypothetical protein